MTLGMPIKTAEVFKVLVHFAKDGRTVTYKEVGEAVNLHWRQVPLRLYAIWQWCENRQPPLPHLNAIAVNAKTGLPGRGYAPHNHPLSREEFQETKHRIFAYNWDSVHFPDT